MKLVFGLAALASVAFADVTYNVVGFPSAKLGSFGVSIGGTITKLVATEHTFPVWSATVPGTTTAQEYSYVELSPTGTPVKTEAFARRFTNLSETSTLNEYFERPTTVWELPHIPYTYLATYPSKTKAFKHKQIATIHVTGPALSMSEMILNPDNGKDYKVDFRFINSKTIHTQRNITFGTSGKSSKDHTKQAFKFKFDTDFNQTFFHRPNIKLRSMVMDPTLMREKLYIDMLNSAGVPTQQGAWVRLFVNEEPYGLYLMVDDIKPSFLKQTVHGGDPLIERGSLVQMNAWNERKADLVYKGPTTVSYDTDVCYKSQNLGKNPITDPLKELIELMSSLNSFDPLTTPNPIAYWEERLDLDGFLRNMAMEYLAGGFDNYWISASNYFMYKNPTLGPTGKWQWIPTDFDGTFGNGAATSKLGSYKVWYDNLDGPRPLVTKLILQNAAIRAKFEQILKELVQTAFKPEALNPRIETYNRMLYLDAQWDYGLVRKSPGENRNFTFADFNNGINVQTPHMTMALKPWVALTARIVSQELGFVIPPELVDRVPPPPRTNGSIDNEDDNDGGDEAPAQPEGSTSGQSRLGQSSRMAGKVVAMIVVFAVALVL